MNNRKIIVIYTIILIIILVLFIVCTIKLHILPKAKKKIDDMISSYRMNTIDKNIENKIKSYEPFKEDEDAWYSRYNFISHAAGRIDGKIYTNSREAYENSYNNGNRVFDADLRFTSDGVLILRHDWGDDLEQDYINLNTIWIDELKQQQIPLENAPSYKEFKQNKIFYKYTSMSFEDVLDFMNTHKDTYIACDCKEDVEKTYTYIVKLAKDKNMEKLLDRIIVSFYKFEDYEKIKKIYSFKNYMARQQWVYPQNHYELVKFCLDNDIKVVNISSQYMTDESIKLFTEKNIKLYVAVVDSIREMKKYIDLGAKGAISNDLYEDDMIYIEN